jgi:hypothetical protein
MLQTKAAFRRKDTEIETKDCVVDKVIRLSGAEFDRFSRNLMRDWDFLRDNCPDRVVDKDGRYHCLLVVGNGGRDGILVNPEGGSYARYSAFMPNAEDFLTVGQYPALAGLNKKLTDIVDFIGEQTGQRYVFGLDGFETMSGINFEFNDVLLNTLLNMLGEKPEIADIELERTHCLLQHGRLGTGRKPHRSGCHADGYVRLRLWVGGHDPSRQRPGAGAF